MVVKLWEVGDWIGTTTVYACCACRFRLAGKENAIRRGEEVKCLQCGGDCGFEKGDLMNGVVVQEAP